MCRLFHCRNRHPLSVITACPVPYPHVREIEMVLLSAKLSAPYFSTPRLCARSRLARSATLRAQATSDNSKLPRRKAPTVPSAGSALSGLTFQPLQKVKKGAQPFTSGLVCTDKECQYKADEGTVAWLRELFDGLDMDRLECIAGHSEGRDSLFV